jgi:glutathione S-transferase
LLQVPVYIEGDKSSPSLVLKESVAICLYLLEKFDTEGRLYPKDVVGRGKVLQYALFAASQAYPIISDMWAQGPENVYGDPLDKTPRIVASLNKVGTHSRSRFTNKLIVGDVPQRWEQVILPFIATELGNQQFLLGDKPTAADFILAYDAICSNHYKLPLNNSIVEAWHKRVMAIPSFAKTYFGN